jgi:hypothetical protein
VAHTMVDTRRLDNVHQFLERVLADRVVGDFIETPCRARSLLHG